MAAWKNASAEMKKSQSHLTFTCQVVLTRQNYWVYSRRRFGIAPLLLVCIAFVETQSQEKSSVTNRPMWIRPEDFAGMVQWCGRSYVSIVTRGPFLERPGNLKGQSHELRMRDVLPLGALTQ